MDHSYRQGCRRRNFFAKFANEKQALDCWILCIVVGLIVVIAAAVFVVRAIGLSTVIGLAKSEATTVRMRIRIRM